jgi:hypothetical protein
MSGFRWKFHKRKFDAVKPAWRHEAAYFRGLMQKQPQGPDRKFLECLLFLRLGYKPAQVAEMTNLDVVDVQKHVKTYNRRGLKGYEPVEQKEPQKQKAFEIPVITPREGCDFFLKVTFGLPKEILPWQILFLAYAKTVFFMMDHKAVVSEIASELRVSKVDVMRTIRSYFDAKNS